MAGKGLASLITSTASSNFLFAIRLIYALTLTPAGQAFEHSVFSLEKISYFLLLKTNILSFLPIK
jgi:hypothetical protein